MTRFLLPAVVLAFGLSAVRAETPEGNWRLSQKLSAAAESPLVLIQLKKEDGKLAISVLDKSNPRIQFSVSDAKLDGSTLTFTLQTTRKLTFEGTIDAKDTKVIRGRLFDDNSTFRAMLSAQDGNTIVRPATPKPPEPMAEAQRLNSAVLQLRNKILQTKEPDDRKALIAQYTEKQKEADAKTPDLYREVVGKHSDSPYAIDAATNLLRTAGRIKPKADEVAAWLKLVLADAALYGPAVMRDTALQMGETLVSVPDHAAAALPLAETAAKELKETDPLSAQARVFKLLAAAEKAVGKSNPATEARLTKIEALLDADYLKRVPPFKPEKFAGRKDSNANRVVVMELFTGAQCPPCVAADVAFDALEKAYSPKDLVLIQYHMHIPGPDPLTNPSSIARWDFYRTKFAAQVRGTPSTLFNGKPEAGGGGGMANAENKFGQYAGIINPLLEQKTDVKVSGSAKASGDKVSAAIAVDGIAEPGEKVRLHVLLVEETVKYVGGNQLRFHHQVVRALAADGKGFEIREKSAKQSVDFDLGEVKKTLTTYLNDFAAQRPFPNPDRPMDLKNLKVIALVQNHDSFEILNAVQLDVEGK